MKKSIGLGVALLAAVSTIAACSSNAANNGSGASTSPSSKGQVAIGFITCTGSPYCTAGYTAAKAAAAKYDATVDIIGYPPTTEGVISACNDAVTKQKYKALILESTIDPAGVPCASLAKQNNLPLIVTQDNIGSNPEDPKPTVPGVTSQIIIPLTDQAKALVYMVGQACLKLNPCNVGWLRATQSNAVTDSLVSTQLKSLTASDVNVKIVDQASPELDETTAVQDTTQFFSKSSDINVILTELSQSGDGALVALGQLGKPSGAVKVITTGCGTSEVKQVRSGQLFGCIPSVPVTETQLAVQYAASAARGAKIPDAVEPLTLEHLPQYLDTDNINQYPSFVGQFEL